jgi:hypothetical protein
VRGDVEQRLLDRMEGALAVSAPASDRSAAATAALLVGFDFAVREGFLHLLGTPPAGTERDPLADMLRASTAPASPVLGVGELRRPRVRKVLAAAGFRAGNLSRRAHGPSSVLA